MTNKHFQQSIADYNTPVFRDGLKTQLKKLPPGSLPLDKGLTQGGYVDDNNIDVMILNETDDAQSIRVKLGVFYTEIVINCGCGDDPMPINAYCEMQMILNKQTAEAEFKVIE